MTLLEKKLMLKKMEFQARKVLRLIYGPPLSETILHSFRYDIPEIIALAARDLKNSINKEVEKKSR